MIFCGSHNSSVAGWCYLFDHHIVDAYSTNIFLLGWLKLSCSKSISLVPSFSRSLLQHHCPGYYSSTITHLYIPASSLSPPNSCNLISRIYHVTSEYIHRLQILSKAYPKLQAFSAFLWQKIGKSMKSNPEKTCKMGIVVDGRSRLNSDMSSYFGNVLGVTFRKLTAEDLRSMKLSEILAIVDEMTSVGTKKEQFQGLINMIEEQKAKGVRSRIYCEEEDDEAAFMVSSGRKIPVSKVDFGWGQPIFGSYHFGWGGKVGHIMPMPSISGARDWVVYEALEVEGEGIFRSLTSGHLKIAGDSDEK